MHDDDTDDDRAEYIPSPGEIAEACVQIQLSWTHEERESRLRGWSLKPDKCDGELIERQANERLAERLAKPKPQQVAAIEPIDDDADSGWWLEVYRWE